MRTNGNNIAREAAADLSTKQFYVVKTNSVGKIVLASAATDAILGVLNNAPKLGDTADIELINGNGTGEVIAGGAITKDSYITSDANGKAVVTTTAGDRVFGRALAAAASGDVFEYVKIAHIYAIT